MGERAKAKRIILSNCVLKNDDQLNHSNESFELHVYKCTHKLKKFLVM